MLSTEVLPAVDWEALLARIPGGKVVVQYEADSRIFRQGDPADSLFYLRGGKVKLSVTSEEGKEAIITILDADEFFGEGCLAGQPLRMATATAVEASALTRIVGAIRGSNSAFVRICRFGRITMTRNR